LLIAAILAECDDQPELLGPLAGAESARTILGAAQRTRAEALDGVLMHPQVGSWGAYVLRRRRGGADSDEPLWIDFGVLHAVALVAATRAGLPWQTRLPVRAGELLLPTLGVARFDPRERHGVVQATTANGRIELSVGEQHLVVPNDPADAPGWWANCRVRTGDDLVLDAFLDDIDAYRDLADPIPARRMSLTERSRWMDLLGEAWELLCRDHRDDAEGIAAGVRSIVPLATEPGWATRSASTGEAFGAVMLSEPPDAVTMAVTLVHEFQHIKLGALMHLVPLSHDDGQLYHAPWRDDPRPLGGFIHGIFAFAGIAAFFRRRSAVASDPDLPLMAFEYAYTRRQVTDALQTVRGATGLTDAGNMLIGGLIDRCTPWLAEPLPSDLVRLADLVADGHLIVWRLRHQRHASDDVVRLAKAWRDHERPDVLPMWTLEPDAEMVWPHRLPALARRRTLAGAEPAPDAPATPGSPVDAAEDDLIAGRHQVALEAFTSAIVSGLTADDEVRGWAGLALAAIAAGESPAGLALDLRPGLVRDIYTELVKGGTRADPLRLAAWLAGGILAVGTGVPAQTAGMR
jgi:HEXXH motif-containing protein